MTLSGKEGVSQGCEGGLNLCESKGGVIWMEQVK